MIESVLEEYITAFSEKETPYLKTLHDYTFNKAHGAHMISGALQGAFLRAMSLLKQPKNILEIGTFTGYSALCLVEGLQENGKLITLDKSEEHLDFMKKIWKEAGRENQIQFIQGDAEQIIPNINMFFDLVFVDANKRAYENYVNLVLPKMPKGGCIIVDNVLFRKEPIMDEEHQSKTGKFMDAFNQKMAKDNRVHQIILPLRDGISLLVKK